MAGVYGWFIKNGPRFVRVVNAAAKQVSLVSTAAQATRFDTAAQASVAQTQLALGAPYTVADATIPPAAPAAPPAAAAPAVTAEQVRAARLASNKAAIAAARQKRAYGGGAHLIVPATPNPAAVATPIAPQRPTTRAAAIAAPSPGATAPLPQAPVTKPASLTATEGANTTMTVTPTPTPAGPAAVPAAAPSTIFHTLAERIAATKTKWAAAVSQVNADLDGFDAQAPVVLGHAHVAVQLMNTDLQGLGDGLNALAEVSTVPLSVASTSPPVAPAVTPAPAAGPAVEAAPAPAAVPAPVAPAPIPMAPIVTPVAVPVGVKS